MGTRKPPQYFAPTRKVIASKIDFFEFRNTLSKEGNCILSSAKPPKNEPKKTNLHNLPPKLALLIATGGGLGYFPKAPGTLGSLAACLAGYALGEQTFLLAGLAVVALLAGAWSCSRLSQNSDFTQDDGRIVVDEIAACFLGILFLPQTSLISIAGFFVAFRFFDILKPLGIKSLEARCKNAWGVMLDDTLAALYAVVVIHSIYWIVSL